MVIVLNICKVALKSYSLFSSEMWRTVSSVINTCLHPLRKYMLPATWESYGFLTMFKLFALLYWIHLCVLQIHELLCLNCIKPFHQYACYWKEPPIEAIQKYTPTILVSTNACKTKPWNVLNHWYLPKMALILFPS